MKLSDKAKLLIAWSGALIMQIIFVAMAITQQMNIERYYRIQQRQPARIVRLHRRNEEFKKQILVAK